AARSWRRRRRIAWLRREPADAPAESSIAVGARYGARCPLVVIGLPVRERRSEVDPARRVEVPVVGRGLGALYVLLGPPEVRWAVRARQKSRAVAAELRRVHADGPVDDPLRTWVPLDR